MALIQKIPNTAAPALSTGGDVTTLSTGASASAVTVGNIVIAKCVLYRVSGSVSTPTFSDSDGNTWVVDKNLAVGDIIRVIQAHCYPANAVNLNITVNTAAGAVMTLGAEEHSEIELGLGAGGSASSSNTATGTAVTTGAIAGTGDNLYSAVCTWDASAGSIACTPGQTQIHENENNTYLVSNSQYVYSSGSQNLAWTLASSKLWVSVGVAYAKAAASTYTVNGHTGGSAPTDGNSPYAESATVTVLSNSGSLVKTGYIFSGWNTAADGSGTTYQPANTFSMPAANVTLYAIWTLNIIVIQNPKYGIFENRIFIEE
jgi:uncharacterized repeat protein (TIGR02543 family)